MATAKTPAKSAAKGKKPLGPKPGEYPGKIVDIDVSKEVSESFLEYAYSVIYSRALPDARDGLKPVHRRILHQMADMGLRPERGHVKSARVVGEVMGKLHPHGDGAIYDALVRMAQSFSMRLPLIDGHGNFGSLDAGPAAMRYTEARLASAAMAMVAEADENTVDFGPNYDGQLAEPLVLPAAYPNLLVNGGSGIAVGMATNMAPHNLGEVIAATKFLIENPSATVKQLMKFVPGPDFPTGGELVGLDGHGLGLVQDGQLAGDFLELVAVEDELVGDELGLGELGHVEDVGALEVLVEGGGARAQRVHFQHDFDLAGLGITVEFHGAALLVEAHAVGRGTVVVDLERGEGVRRVDGVGCGSRLGSGGEQAGNGQGKHGSAHERTPRLGLHETEKKRANAGQECRLQLAHAGQGQLELHLDLVGHHGGIAPFAFADLELQALERQRAGGRGRGAGLCQLHGNAHVLDLALDAELAVLLVLADAHRLDGRGVEDGLREFCDF